MSESPSDLAVAFRSFGRRLEELMGPAEDDPDVAEAAAPFARQLVETVASAAGELGVPASGEVAPTGAAIADKIRSIPADQWDAATLDHLRAMALDAGRILRELDAAVDAARKH